MSVRYYAPKMRREEEYTTCVLEYSKKYMLLVDFLYKKI